MWTGLKLIGVLLMLIGLLLILRCGGDVVNTGDVVSEASATMVSQTGCKRFDSRSTMVDISSSLDCVDYEYDGTANLNIRRTNTGFNCCPDSLTASVEISGSVISIDEIEWVSEPCRCLCLYDMEYAISGVAPGTVTLQFNEPYLEEGDAILSITVDLAAEPSGSICVERSHYPWGVEQ
ncbi:MAG: hypothetical protein GF341_06015 [candidate division Zixibacteria bacterium]|nr:hypothetical protein [candidate division Zixibacteria bacterium]